MKIYRAYKTELDPNNRQKTLFSQHIGCARWAYNFALSKKKEAFDKKEKIPNAIELSRELNKLKKTEIPWMYESSSATPLEALFDCDTAFKNFFREIKKKNKKVGFPKFKSKKNEKQSFQLKGCIKVLDGYIQLPRLGRIKLFEKDYLPKDSKILSATISKRANRWFVSIKVEEEYIPKNPQGNGTVVGVDLGIKTLATCSNGLIYENPKALNKNLKKLKRKQKELSRRKKGGRNYEKSKQKVAKLHYHISNIRKDCLHKITSEIVNENQVIVLEDLKVSNMIKNHYLAQAINDVGLYEFRRQIEYKAEWNERKVVLADTFYPSSKLCSSCGWKNPDLTLGNRTFECGKCGMKMNRDLNASLNLKQLYNSGSSSQIQACGDGSSEEEIPFSPSVKQEFNLIS